MSKTHDGGSNQKNSKQDIDVADFLYDSIAPQLEKGEIDTGDITVEVDISGVSFERQAVGVPIATAALNQEYDYNLWAHPYHITGDIEAFAENHDTPVEQVKDDFISPEELEATFGEIISESDESNSEPENAGVSQKAAKKIENIPEVLNSEDFEKCGVKDIGGYLETVIDRLKDTGHTVFNNQVNASYLLYSGNTEMSRDEKLLFGRIAAYVLGHSGCRVGVWDGHVVAVDDVRMYANRHGFDPQEFVEQSWSQKEAEMELGDL
jgi:hypothetical protein